MIPPALSRWMRQTMVDAFRNARFFTTFASTKSLMRHRRSQRLKNVAASLYGPGACGTVKAVMIPPELPVQVGFPTRRRHGWSRCPLPAALNRLPEPVLQQGNDPHSRVVVHPAPFLSLYLPTPTVPPMSAYQTQGPRSAGP